VLYDGTLTESLCGIVQRAIKHYLVKKLHIRKHMISDITGVENQLNERSFVQHAEVADVAKQCAERTATGCCAPCRVKQEIILA